MKGLNTTRDLEEAADPIAYPVKVNRTAKGTVVVFEPLKNGGGWAAIREPGWTCFGDTPEEAFTALNEKHPLTEKEG